MKKRTSKAPLPLVGHSVDALEAAAADEYRANLQRLAEEAQSDYDKAVMTLSGGALGISFGYLKDIAGPPPHEHVWLLVISWVCWTGSVTACLYSLATSASALRKAIEQHDLGSIDTERPGGLFDRLTTWLNSAGGILFTVGTIFMIAFAVLNQNEQPKTITQSPPAASPAATATPTGSSPATAPTRPAGASSSANQSGAAPSVTP